MTRLCKVCKEKFAEIPLCERCYDDLIEEERRSVTTDKLIAEFQKDFEEIVRYFKLDGHLVGTIREKWKGRKK